MGVVVISVVVALIVAVVIGGIVVVGMRGGLPEVSEKAPDIAGGFEWAARQLNGEAETSPRPVGPDRAVTGRRADRATPAGQQPDARSDTTTPGSTGVRESTTDGAGTSPDRSPAPRRSSLPSTGDFGG